MVKTLQIGYEEYSTWEELDKEDFQLIQEAKLIRETAYAKYSDFRVGAALLLDNGKIIVGNNQENAAYPSGLCAERTAIFYAIANYPDAQIVKMAVVAGKDENTDNPVAPCGACRQVLLEYETRQKKPFEFLFTGMKGRVIKFHQTAQLLPFCFDGSQL
ncbi:cytidine deaminase [Apibacter sp. HY039]|uniref:cytidine deaminase n=1 Tax=Apibacter sp. HY039 TaxID=2501476 RepID=UPI000FEBE600|nr:cytidine deaminase [Apibacter sp. HY039]